MSTRQHDISQDEIQAHAIADYLRNHPEFFVTHTGLLADIRIPHHAEGTVSLIERQVSVLRERNQELKRQLHTLVQVARDNDQLNEQMQRLTLALMEAPDLSSTLHILKDTLLNDFRADALVLGLFMTDKQLPHIAKDDSLPVRTLRAEDEGAAGFTTLLTSGKPLCGHLRSGQLHYLFGGIAEENIASVVVLALTAPGAKALQPGRMGMLGIGSRDPKRYHAGMGTLFLAYLGELIGRAIGRYLPLQ